MTETSSSHVGEERAFHAAPRGSQHGPMQDSMDDFTTAEALDIFSDKLERALRRQKQEIVNELNLTSKSTEKKVPDFKFQSNKIQFEFNSDREHDILKAVNLLKSNNVESAIDALNSVVKDLNKRNKVVRIADKYGWDVVQEYQDDPITDDADDATKLRQAIFRAKKRNNNRKPYERNNRSYSGQDSQGLPGQFFRPHGQDFGSSCTRAEYGRYPYYQPFTSSQQWYRKAASSSSGSSGAAARNICFYCNKFGHWANKCPEKGNGSFTNTASATASGSKQ